MKVLGVTQRVTVAPGTGEKRDCLAQDWRTFFSALGVRWIALPNHTGTAVDLAGVMCLDGIVLSGGDDIGVFPERDAAEFALLEWCRQTETPALGVCRGFQVMHHWLGGRLQEVSPDTHVAKRHIVTLQSGDKRDVNSYHTFAPDFTGLKHDFPLQVTANCAVDGSVEAAAGKGMLGIMWHPEREAVPNATDVAVFKEHFAL